MNACIVCLLSHSMYVKLSIFICMVSKNRFHHIFVLAVIDIANNSAFVELVVIVFCLNAFQLIIPSYNLKQYSCELCLVLTSSAKETFNEIKKTACELTACSL